MAGHILKSNLEDSCTIDRVYFFPLRRPMSDNSSLATIYDALAYGFDVSWLYQTCDNTALLECNRRNGTCFARINYAPVCIQYCYLYIPLFQIKFKDRVFNPFNNERGLY
ncbi:hypothetical protein ACJIZ3_023584 [Penstemon smallii]|uniref:Uncharacterized protein n=1 Tax=Penstemon smallii TaxID=265156 RepID=A0ABD3TRY0_9LAMI